MRNLWIFLIFISFTLFGQGSQSSKRDNAYLVGKNFFGIHFNPIIPTNIFQKNDYSYSSDTASFSINNIASFSYGAEIRHYFTYRFALVSGITYIKRNIKVDFDSQYPQASKKTDASFSEELHFTAFEIPIQAVGYVRLTQEIYMDIAGGINLNFYPSHLKVNNVVMQRIIEKTL